MPSKVVTLVAKRFRDVTVFYDDGGIAKSHFDYSDGAYSQLTKSWVNTPGFSALRSKGQLLPSNGFSYITVTRKGGGGVISTKFPGGVERVEFSQYANIGYRYHDNYLQGLDPNDLNGRLIKQMQGQQWSAPIFFAEAGKTVNMVVARATHLAKLANYLRRGNLPAFCKELRNVVAPSERRVKRYKYEYGRDPRAAAGNAWLEYRYGWMPFVKDVQDATNTLMDVVDQPQRRKGTVRASQQFKSVTSNRELVFNDGQYADAGQEIVERYASITAKCSFVPNAQDLPGRFGLLNPLEVAWELLPFSFVVDWFVPVGNYLSALDVPMRFSFAGGTYGLRKETVTRYYPDRMNPYEARLIDVTRTPMQGLPTVDLTIGGGLNSGSRVTSALALLNQQISGFKRRPDRYRFL